MSDQDLIAELRRRGFESGPAGSYSRLSRELQTAERDAGLAARAVLRGVYEEARDD